MEPNEKEIIALKELVERLSNIKDNTDDQSIQYEIYEIGKKHNFSNLRDFFKLIYRILLGQDQGPRLGSFIKVFGIDKTCELINKILTGKKI